MTRAGVVAVSRSDDARPATSRTRRASACSPASASRATRTPGAKVQHLSRVARDAEQPNLRQVHLIHAELHDELRAAGFDVAPGQMGENVTTRGVDLLGLPAGDAPAPRSETRWWRSPACAIRASSWTGSSPGLMAATLDRDADGELVRKAGVMGVVSAGGEVQPGRSDPGGAAARAAERAPARLGGGRSGRGPPATLPAAPRATARASGGSTCGRCTASNDACAGGPRLHAHLDVHERAALRIGQQPVRVHAGVLAHHPDLVQVLHALDHEIRLGGCRSGPCVTCAYWSPSSKRSPLTSIDASGTTRDGGAGRPPAPTRTARAPRSPACLP